MEETCEENFFEQEWERGAEEREGAGKFNGLLWALSGQNWGSEKGKSEKCQKQESSMGFIVQLM